MSNNPQYILKGIEDFINADLVYFSMLQEHGEKLYICFGKRAFYLIDFEPPVQRKFYYAWVHRVVLDVDDPTLFMIEFEQSQGTDALYLNSAIRNEVMQEMQICWQTDHMMRKWETAEFPIKHGKTQITGAFVAIPSLGMPFAEHTRFEQGDFYFFLPSRFSQDVSPAKPPVPSGFYIVKQGTAEERRELMSAVYEPPVTMTSIGKRWKDAIRLKSESHLHLLFKHISNHFPKEAQQNMIDRHLRIVSSVPLTKRVNLSGDVATYTTWFLHARTELREVGIMVVRRNHVPPLGTHYQDSIFRYLGIPDMLQDNEEVFQEPFQKILDSFSPISAVTFFDDTIVSVHSHALLFDDAGFRWVLGLSAPSCLPAAQAFVKSIVQLLQKEGPPYSTNVAEEIEKEIMLVEDPWEIIADIEEDCPGLAFLSGQRAWLCWHAKVAHFFSFCVNDGLRTGVASLKTLAEVSMREDSPSESGPEEAVRLLEYFLHLRARGTEYIKHTTLYEKVADRNLLQDFECNETVLAVMLETGYLEHFLNENEPALFIPFVKVLLSREDTTVDLLIALCAQVATISTEASRRATLASAGLVTPLTDLLQTTYEPVLVAVTKALVNLTAQNEKAKSDFVQAGGPRQFAPHLKSQSPDLLKCLCLLAKNLAGSDETRASIRDSGCIEHLVSLLRPVEVPGVRLTDDVLVAACAALWNLCNDDDARTAASGYGATRVVCDLFNTSTSVAVKAKSSTLLMMLMINDPNNVTTVAGLEIIPRMVDVVAHSKDTDLLRGTLGAMCVMAMTEDLAVEMKRQDVETYLEKIQKMFAEVAGADQVLKYVDNLTDVLRFVDA